MLSEKEEIYRKMLGMSEEAFVAAMNRDTSKCTICGRELTLKQVRFGYDRCLDCE